MSDDQNSSCSPSEYRFFCNVDDEITFIHDHLVSILSEEALLRQRLEQLFQKQEKEADEAIERAKQHRRDIAKAREEMMRNIQREKYTSMHDFTSPVINLRRSRVELFGNLRKDSCETYQVDNDPAQGDHTPKLLRIKGKTISVEDAEYDIDYPESLFMTRKERNRTKKTAMSRRKASRPR
ncbi:hypothetical protein FRC17_006606 [Serendipita sp. 399]|nr:hypothetical protein FRC17_006606 [Serendipita sp. 399]